MKTITLTYPHQLKKEHVKETVIALGFFDGVHLGHQQVISTAKQIAVEKNMQSAVMTFNPHPKEVLRGKNEKLEYLSPLPEKIRLIEKLGVDVLYVVQFTQEFANLTPQQFVDDYLIGLNVKHVVAGFDYSYGKLGKGTMETLPFHSREQFTQTTISKVETDHEKISSSNIRILLTTGDVDKIPSYLGRYYEIRGKVIHGEKRGRSIGFPTANIDTDRYFLPTNGVYAVYVKIQERTYEGVCNIGFKPTFHDNAVVKSVEIHVFEFNDEIYDENITVQWIKRIRSEKKFAGVQQLIDQIASDKASAKQILTKLDMCSCNL
ncbi:bifunctional riboflavin kinase/FAD synthetase [Anaerobacillus alkaliphilus]|uniref:Riboflavin biosynthesis protein n=1 Tax=Anaerobacillus alkaliphilus TaxID=1548597 RepID=A0A4Q0VNQ3_9BACI|nr:bifunctional riboflavin kinase/FAD synthetase [Anaerobacillus alkaliphilus]RXI97963.1 bifunctional riboflavin kinase/FAD synthetase [Anaerobacillus alkaliphilus]